MHYSRYRQSDYLEAASQLIECAVHDRAISDAMADVGYNRVKLSEGEECFLLFKSKFDNHDRLTADKLSVNKKRSEHLKEMRKTYMRALKIARIAFQDNAKAKEDLWLEGEREKDVELWMEQVKKFCVNLEGNETYMTKIEQFGISADIINSLKKFLSELEVINNNKVEVESELIMLTKEKKEAMLKFQKWLSDYVKMARIRFDDNTDVLKRLRIIEQ